MKRAFYAGLFASAMILASCAREGGDPGKRYPLGDATIDISADFTNKAVKKGWEEGDRINIWFDEDYSQDSPDLVLCYDGASWAKESVRDDVSIGESGTLCALYETTNDLGEMYKEKTATSSVYRGANFKGDTKVKCTPMLIASNARSYSYDPSTTKLTAEIDGWEYITRIKVVVTGLSSTARNCALKAYRPDNKQAVTRPYASFGPQKDENSSRAAIAGTTSTTTYYAGGVQEGNDTVAFYFNGFSAEIGESVYFGMRLAGASDKLYVIKAPGSIVESKYGCKSIHLDFSKFSEIIDGGIGAEAIDSEKDVDLDVPADVKIVYQPNDLDDSCTYALALELRQAYAQATGKVPEVIDGSKVKASGREIIIGHTNRDVSTEYYSTKKNGKDAFEYTIEEKDGNVAILGVGSWALKYACEEFADDFAEHGYVEGKKIEGTVRGKELFRYSSGCNLRIFDCNVWERGNYTINPPFWEQQGEDCRYEARVKNFTQIIRAYKYPDVICTQEYTNEFNKCLKDSLEKFGYSFAQRAANDYTSIIFNSNKLTFLKKYHHVFGKYSDDIDPGERKSYTINVFRHKITNKEFMVVTTHLWARVNTDEDFLCKLDEIQQVYAGIEEALKDYNVPVFLTGDMNCKRASKALQYLETRGYLHMCDAMPDPDGSMGWHPCGDDGYKREYDPGQETWWMGNKHDRKEKGKNCVDQFYMYNYGSTQAKAYEHIHAYFTVLLGDHYPTYADFILF